jgi:hypothetical protein
MPYTLNKTNGIILTVVQDGKIDVTSSDLTFVGKNYTGYGQVFNENFVKLLENFANPLPPTKPLIGEVWYDSSNKILKVNNGTSFKSLGFLDNGASRPTVGLNLGDLWWDKAVGALWAWNGNDWTKIGPAITSSVTGAVVPATITGADTLSHLVLESQINNVPISITADAAFGINSTDSLYSNYNTIYRGINLAGTNAAGISASLNNSGSPTGTLLWGTAMSALGMVSTSPTTGLSTFVSAGDYLQRAELSNFSGSLTVNSNDGMLLGIGGVMKLHVTNSTEGNISIVNGNKFNINVLNNGNQYFNIISATTGTGNTGFVNPNPSANISLGNASPGGSFYAVYANSVNASIISVNTLSATLLEGSGAGITSRTIPVGSLATDTFAIVGGTGISVSVPSVALGSSVTINNGGITSIVGTANQIATSQPTGDTVLSLPQNIDLRANVKFQSLSIDVLKTTTTSSVSTVYGTWQLAGGASFQATYADIAERYASDEVYPAGTVLVVGGSQEVTFTTNRADVSVAGIVSSAPAFKLNSAAGTDDTHPYIALKGRVPCKVIGPVKKGDLLVTSATSGFGESMQPTDSPNAAFAKALQDFAGESGIIEVMVI